MTKIVYLFLFCLLCNASRAQNPVVTILAKTGDREPVAGATVKLGDYVFITNEKGRASGEIPAGTYPYSIMAVGFDTLVSYITITTDTSIVARLIPSVKRLNEVVVSTSRNVSVNEMSRQTISISQLKKLPVLLGEIDPLKAITLLPGVKGGGDASAGIYVRGGGPDQNLVLLDGVPVYNPNHLLGFFSIFNGDAIKGVEVFKGGIPARYGGRLSSVIAIESRDADKQKTTVTGGIGLIASRLSVETPIVKGRSSVIVSARRTYIDQIAKPFAGDRIGGNGYFFYDLNGKADYIINSKNKLNLVFYTGQDDFTFSNTSNGRNRQFDTDWGNTLVGFNWQQSLSSRLKQTTGLVYNQFALDSRFGFSTLSFLFTSGLRDYQAKSDWEWQLNNHVTFTWGAQYIWHRFRPGAGGVTAGVQEFKSQVKDQYAHEAAGYADVNVDLSKRINLVAGLRYSYFNQVGPTERILYGEDGIPTGEREVFGRGESVARYHYPEPRLNVLFRLNDQSSIKAAYTRTMQYLHLATTSSATFPSDLWIPSSRLIRPGRADQVAIGYFRNFKNDMFEFSAEAYYKTLSNQIEFSPGAQLLLNQNLEGEMIFGTGKAYGIELFLQKKRGRLTGWLGYTLSRAERRFAELNQGKAFPFRYDRTHDLSLVLNYSLSKKWEFSSVFVYGTGNALTMPNGRFTYGVGYNPNEQLPILPNINQYSAINDYRVPAYHRLDVSFTYTRRPESKRRFKSSWNFGIYNVYNRYNPFFIYLSVEDDTQTIQGKKVFLFPIIPSVTWNVKFNQ